MTKQLKKGNEHAFLRATNLYFVENKVEKVVTNEEGTIKLPGKLMTTQKQIIFYVPCSMLHATFNKHKNFLKKNAKKPPPWLE